MPISAVELAKARDTAQLILEELGLDAYLFEVEPQENYWELKIECASAIDGAWTSISLQVPHEEMLAGFDDMTAKEHLFEYWRKKLSACKQGKDLG